MTQLYELRIVATGEVRDAEGNLISREPIEATAVLTEEQAIELTKQQEEQR